MFLSCYMESALLRYYEQELDKRRLVSTYLWTQAALAILFLSISLLLGPPLTRRFLGFEDHKLLLAVACAAAATPFYTHALTLLRAQRAAGFAARLIVAHAAISSLLPAALLLARGPDLATVFFSRATADSFCALATVLTRRSLYGRCYSQHTLLQYLKFGGPLLPEGAIAFLGAHASQLYVLSYASVAEVGLLALANRLASGVRLVLASLRQAWQPFAFSVKDHAAIDALVVSTFKAYAQITLLLLAASTLAAREIILIFAGPPYSAAVPLLGPVIAGSVLSGLPYLFATGLLLENKTYYYTLGTLLSSLASVATGWWTIRHWGIIAAPFAAIAGALVFSTVVFLASRRVRGASYGPRPFSLFILVVVAIATLAPLGVANLPLPVRSALLFLSACVLLSSSPLARKLWPKATGFNQ